MHTTSINHSRENNRFSSSKICHNVGFCLINLKSSQSLSNVWLMDISSSPTPKLKEKSLFRFWFRILDFFSQELNPFPNHTITMVTDLLSFFYCLYFRYFRTELKRPSKVNKSLETLKQHKFKNQEDNHAD